MNLPSKIKQKLFGRRRYDRGDSIEIYRCTECGYVALTLGGLHGHIEGHRRLWNFWRIGWDTDYLMERTERLWLEPIDREPASELEASA